MAIETTIDKQKIHRRITIDLETLGVGDNAGIVQVALLVTDYNGKHIANFERSINPIEILMDGFESERDCMVKFWSKNRPLMDNIIEFGESPKDVARDVHLFLDKHIREADVTETWANGILFDIIKLDRFLVRYGYVSYQNRVPYNSILDYRSVRKFCNRVQPNINKLEESIKNVNPHNAAADCMYQEDMLMGMIGHMSELTLLPVTVSESIGALEPLVMVGGNQNAST